MDTEIIEEIFVMYKVKLTSKFLDYASGKELDAILMPVRTSQVEKMWTWTNKWFIYEGDKCLKVIEKKDKCFNIVARKKTKPVKDK